MSSSIQQHQQPLRRTERSPIDARKFAAIARREHVAPLDSVTIDRADLPNIYFLLLINASLHYVLFYNTVVYKRVRF